MGVFALIVQRGGLCIKQAPFSRVALRLPGNSVASFSLIHQSHAHKII